MKYYNEIRTHLSLDKDAPVSRTIVRAGQISAARSWAGYITNMSGFDLRQGQPPIGPKSGFTWEANGILDVDARGIAFFNFFCPPVFKTRR